MNWKNTDYRSESRSIGMQLPALVGQDKTLYDTLKEIHQTMGTIGYYLIGLNAAAALIHHYVKHGNTLLFVCTRSQIMKPIVFACAGLKRNHSKWRAIPC